MSDADQVIPAPIGERLRIAREAKGMTLDDVAARTRVPTRHLQHIEKGEWEALPAPTYCVGFARAFANAVGLNGSEIGAELRDQLGGGGPHRASSPAAARYEPADPARVPPRSLAIIAAMIAILLIAGYMIWRESSVEEPIEEAARIETQLPDGPAAAAPVQPQPQQPAATGPVVLTASEEVWLRVYEAGGARIAERTLQAGERFEVPAAAQRPQIVTGRPQALRVTVGNTEIPPLGEPERTISDVSLLPADLLARVRQPAPAR